MPHSKGFARRREQRSADPVPIGQVVDAILQEDVFARGMPVVRLIKAWPDLVGDRMAGATTPVSLEAGILTIRAADTAWASQTRYFADTIKGRAEGTLGPGAVTVVRVVVGRAGEQRNRRSQG